MLLIDAPQQLSTIAAPVTYPPRGAGLKPNLDEYLPQRVQDFFVALFDGGIVEHNQICTPIQDGSYRGLVRKDLSCAVQSPKNSVAS